MTYDYRVDSVRAEVTERSVLDGTAGEKIAAQVELKVREWAARGYELQLSEVMSMCVKGTCLFGLLPSKEGDIQLDTFILYFRKAMK